VVSFRGGCSVDAVTAAVVPRQRSSDRRGRGVRLRVLLVAALSATVAGLVSATAVRAAAGPDPHDRALAEALDTRVAVFRDIDTKAFGTTITHAFRGCLPLERSIVKDKSNVGAAFSGVLTSALDLSLPATIDLADRYRSQLSALRTALGTMHPDSPVFAQWLSAEVRSVGFILEFDNHGQLPDACTAATYMQALAKTSKTGMATALAGFRREVGIDLDQYKSLAPELYSNGDPAEGLSRLAAGMDAFFVAAGLTPKDAAILSSSE
jgi:hypothetical protein